MANTERKIVVFSAGECKYAISIENIERIIGYSTITPLPETVDYVLGLLTYQESILPIIDLNKRFYGENIEIDEGSKILVIHLDDYKMGILVSSVDEIKDITENIVEEPSGIIKGVSPKYIQGLIKEKNDITIVLNVRKILQDEVEKEIIDILENS